MIPFFVHNKENNMDNYNPSQEVVDFLNTNNISISNSYWSYIYNNLRYASSNKISDMLNAATGNWYSNNTGKTNTFYFPVDLAYRAIDDPTKLAFISGASGRATQEAYNAARDNEYSLSTFLSNCGFRAPSRYSSQSKKCIHFIFVSSGFSLIKNFVNASNIERHEFYENIINTYRKQNLENENNASQTLVLKDVYEPTGPIEESITIITNQIPDLTEMMTILLFIQAHYSGLLITNKAALDLTKQAIEQDDQRYPLIQKLRYYLTEYWETELQYKYSLTNDQRNALHEQQTTALESAYKSITKNTIKEAPKRFLQKLAERFNYDYVNKDKQALENCISTLASRYMEIQDLEHKKQVLERKLAVLDLMHTEEIEEFWDALSIYKNITIEATSPTSLILKIVSPLTFYDEESTKAILNNPHCAALAYLKENCEDADIDYNIAKAVIFDIFINKKYQIYTYTRFKLEIASTGYNRVLTIDRYYTGSNTSIIDNKIYQPHIMAYNCYDNAKTKFYAAIAEKKFDVAFGQIVGATQNINTGDSTVLRNFLTSLVCTYDEIPTIYDLNTKTFVCFRDLYHNKETEIEELTKKIATEDIPTVKPISEIEEAPEE